MIRTKGEAGTGNVVEAVRHMRQVMDDIRRIQNMPDDELYAEAKSSRRPSSWCARSRSRAACPSSCSPPAASPRPPTRR